MMLETSPRKSPKAFAVWFKDLERWSVDYFRRVEWRWPATVLRPIGEVLSYKRQEVDGTIPRVELPIIEKISFGGNLSVTEPQDRKEYKGRLFWADSGNLVYSKIRVKQGSVALIPKERERIAVSAEYPVYEIDETKASGKYLELVVRSSVFLHLLDGLSHGGSTKTRIPPEEFEKQIVPLPSLPVQHAIVTAWEKAQAEIAETRRKVIELEEQVEKEFLTGLGLTVPERIALPKAFALWWKDLERWSVMFSQLNGAGVDVHSGKYPVFTLGEVAKVSYGIQKSPANRPGQHARPYLRVANVQRGELDLRVIKKINVPDSEMPTYRLEPGDLLVCEGNSADLVGRPAIWQGEIPDCVHQNHILKVRLDRNLVLPEYVLEFMQTIPSRNYFRSRAKFTTNLASINSNDLRELPLSVPPLDIQQMLGSLVTERRKAIAALRQDLEQKVKKTTKNTEAMILGEKSAMT